MKTRWLFAILATAYPLLSPAQECPPGEISGYVFVDENVDGNWQKELEEGKEGVTVSLYGSANELLQSTTSTSEGQYTFLVNALSGPFTIEAFTNSPFVSSVHGNDTRSLLRVVSSAQCEVNFGVVLPGRYCGDPGEATLVTSCYTHGAQTSGPVVGADTIIGVPETAGSAGTITALYDVPMHSLYATSSEVGTVYGLAYDKVHDTLFAGSFIRRHADLGPTKNPTTIYAIQNISTPASRTVTPWLTLDANRVNPHTGATDSTGNDYRWPADFGAFKEVFKEGLGDIEISEDGRTLYVVELKSRSLVTIPLQSDGSPGDLTTAHLPSLLAPLLPADDCPIDDMRPFGLGVHDGAVYAGIVCSAQSTFQEQNTLPIEGNLNGSQLLTFPGDRSKLKGYILRIDNGSATLIQTLRLDYPRGCQQEEAVNCLNGSRTDWLPWTDTYPYYDRVGSNQHQGVYPQPIISSITFDQDGMSIGVADRWGFQVGMFTETPSDPRNTRSNKRGRLTYPFASGDTLRVCKVNGTYIAEYLLSQESRCKTAGIARQTHSGLFLDEYFFEDDYGSGKLLRHTETSLGALLQLPFRTEVITTAFNPVRPVDGELFDGGLGWFDIETGAWTKGYRVYNGKQNDPLFGKAAGLGDLEALCPLPPLEVGNKVWIDLNKDGIQNPDEPPLAGVELTLSESCDEEDPFTIIGSTTTDIQGEYYFGGKNLFHTGGRSINVNCRYRIDIPANQSMLSGFTLTQRKENLPTQDSNCQPGESSFGIIEFIPTATDHTFDCGVTAIPPTPTPIPTAGISETSLPTPTATSSPDQPATEVDVAGGVLDRRVQSAYKLRQLLARERKCQPITRVSTSTTEIHRIYAERIWTPAWAMTQHGYVCNSKNITDQIKGMSTAASILAKNGTTVLSKKVCTQNKKVQRTVRLIRKAKSELDTLIAKLAASLPRCS